MLQEEYWSQNRSLRDTGIDRTYLGCDATLMNIHFYIGITIFFVFNEIVKCMRYALTTP